MFASCLGRIELRDLAEESASRGAKKSLQWVLAIQFVTRFVTAGMLPRSFTRDGAMRYSGIRYAPSSEIESESARGGIESKKRETLRLPRLTFWNWCTSVSDFSLRTHRSDETFAMPSMGNGMMVPTNEAPLIEAAHRWCPARPIPRRAIRRRFAGDVSGPSRHDLPRSHPTSAVSMPQ
jgi:hypothetical protein